MRIKTEPITVKIVDVDFTDTHEGTVYFEVGSGNTYEAFFWGHIFSKGEVRSINLYCFDLHFDWTVAFSENSAREMKLLKGSHSCEYFGYGRIVQIRPVVADFGDFKLELGNWTNDERVIDEFIYWRIDQLRVEQND